MKRAGIFAISMLLIGVVSMTPARVQAASMAVLVVGLETDAASDMFAASIRYEYTQKNYTVVENAVVGAKQAELRQAYKDGNTVDTVGLAAWGRANSIDFVQLVVEKDCDVTIWGSTVSGREQLSQVVTCCTAKYTERPTYRTQFVPKALNSLRGEMVYLAGGVFEMGCKSGRDDITDSCHTNAPAHYVRVNSFYIGKYEVTQALWWEVMGSLPSEITSDSALLGYNKPVVFVSWDNVAGTGGFLERLNMLTGQNYRLPTEAEWEYAARGCSGGNCEDYEFSGSDTAENVAWYNGNSNGALHPVGQKPANARGLYDMSGNASAHCSDWYSATYYPSGTTPSSPQENPTGPLSGSSRIHRGGRWSASTRPCRIADRGYAPSSSYYGHYGFRLV
jgi:formylglycine-generating enzyme required for sulfatase activity